jgi:hypothetical protein
MAGFRVATNGKTADRLSNRRTIAKGTRTRCGFDGDKPPISGSFYRASYLDDQRRRLPTASPKTCD